MFHSSAAHKSELPLAGSASIDVKAWNRVKDKIFLIVSLALGIDGRSLRVNGEAVGGSSGQVKEALCWSCFLFLFSLSLPCFRSSIPSSTPSPFAFLFFFFSEGWTWFPEAENITGLWEGVSLRVIETAVSDTSHLSWLLRAAIMHNKPLAVCLCLCLAVLAAEGKPEKGRGERQRSSRHFFPTDGALEYDNPFLPGEWCL